MTSEEMQQWAGEAERLHALATSGTVGAEMAAATLRLRGVEYVGALLAERDAAEADRDYWREQATMMAPCVDEIRRLTQRVVRGGTGCALDPVRAVDAAIAEAEALADADLILEERERQLAAALTAVAEERARCAAVCRAISARIDSPEDGGNPYDGRAEVATECAEEIERGPVTP